MTLIIERVLDTRFTFVYNGGDLLSSDQNRLFTDGNYCHFKTATGANIIKQQNVTFEDVTVIDTFGGSGTFTFVNIPSLWNKLIELKFFDGLNSGVGAGGSTTFLGLTDTPSYFGNNGKTLIANESEQKLEYTTFYNFNKFTQLSDVEIASLTEGKIVGVASVGGILKFTLIDKPASGTTYFSAVGGFDYDDLATKTAPLAYTTGNLQLTNDILGPNTFLSKPPYGITSVWDEETNTFDFSQLSEGDEVFLRFNIDHTTSSADQITKVFLSFTDSLLGAFNVAIDENIQDKLAGVHNITRTIHFYVREGWKNNPVYINYNSDASSSIVVNGWHPYIIRKSINVLDVQVKGGSEKPPYELATEGQTEILVDASADNIDIWINQVMQTETIDYNRVSGVATMTYALTLGDTIVYRGYTSESVKEVFTATEAQTAVTLSNNPRNIDVWVNGVYQIEIIGYSISGNIITFTYPLSDGDYINVRKYR